MDSALVAVPLVVLLAGGLATVALVPGSVAARSLLAAGATLTAAWLAEDAAVRHDGVAGTLLRIGAGGLFLAGLAALVALLASYPGTGFERRWHRAVVTVLGVAAAAASVFRLVGDRSPTVGLEPATAIDNPLALDGAGRLGAVGTAVVASEPLWLLVGIAVLALRWRASAPPARGDLGRLLLSVALLGALLVLVVLGRATGAWLPDGVASGLFVVALTLLPLELVRGVTARARALERELAASRLRLIEAEDAARRRIERDLHDGVQQHLVAILALTELAARQRRTRPDAVDETLGDLHQLVSAAISDLREVVSGIRPPVLHDSGVVAALESRFERLPVTVSTDFAAVGGSRFADEVEAAAYFVACEAVTNAMKHAAGSPVHVRLGREADALSVTVRDDGPGLPARPVPSDGGLSGLRDRVESLGGSLSVCSAPGEGCLVTATIPAGERR